MTGGGDSAELPRLAPTDDSSSEHDGRKGELDEVPKSTAPPSAAQAFRGSAAPPGRTSGTPAEPGRGWAVSHPGSLALIVLAAFVVVCAGVKFAAPVLVPVVLGGFVATVDTPLVMWLRRRRIPLWLTVVLALVVDTVLLGGFIWLLVGSVGQLSGRLPQYLAVLQAADARMSTWLQELGVQRTLLEVLDPAAAFGLAASLFGEVAVLLWDTVLALIIAAFLLLRLGRARATGSRPAFVASEPMRRAVREMSRYFAIKTATSVATGLLIGLWSWSIGADLPVLLGLIAFLLNYIPNVGSVIAAVPAVGLGLLQYGVEHGLLLAFGYLLVNTVVGNIVEPRVMGRALGLWPVVVLLSVIFWGWTLGIVGAILSSLLTLVVKAMLLSTEDLRPLGLALGPRLSPARGKVLLEEAMPQRPPAAER